MKWIDIYNRFLECIVLQIGDWVTGGCYIHKVRKWRKLTRLSAEDLDRLQNDGLDKILRFAKKKVKFYKYVDFDGANDVFEMLKKFPIVNKKTINERVDEFLSCRKRGLEEIYTGGSTGYMGRFYSTKKEISETQGMITAIWEWYGYKIGMMMMQTGVMVDRGFVKRLKDVFFRVLYVPAFRMSEKDVLGYLNKVRGKRGYVLAGYSSSLNVFAEVALKYNIEDIKFKIAIGWGDKQFEQYKRNVKRAFSCEMFDSYGCSEGVVVGAKKDLDYYYIFSPHVVVEIVNDEGNEVADGEIGRVILTRLDRWSMPMIRYDVGDLAAKLPRDKYPQNRDYQFPLLESIIGRETDILKMSDGSYMVVEVVETIFEQEESIKSFKVVQREEDKIEIVYIADGDIDFTVKSRVENAFGEYLGGGVLIEWVKVDIIEPAGSGKPQFVERIVKVIDK